MQKFYKNNKEYFQIPVNFIEIAVFMILLWFFIPAASVNILIKILISIFIILNSIGIIPTAIFVFKRRK